MFNGFIQVALTEILQDLKIAPVGYKLSLCTSFVTTYEVAFGRGLAKRFHTNVNVADYERSCNQMCCFGCYVHSKRAISEKLKRFEYNKLYGWAVGTQIVTTVQQRWQALT